MSKAMKSAARKQFIKELKQVVRFWDEITPYQFRLWDELDVYPTSRKYHCLITGKRGEIWSVKGFLLWYYKKNFMEEIN